MTYGDMMSLLLTFFILLVALSEIKKEEVYQSVIQHIQQAFGIRGGGGTAESRTEPKLTLVERLQKLELRKNPEQNESNTDDPGVEGKEAQVTKVREGMLFTQGGRITFEPGSADISEHAKRQLAVVANLIRGYNNKIEVRGHAAAMELGAKARYEDLWTLSFARAKAVMDYLTSPRVGIRPERIRLVANADFEPLAKRVYTAVDQMPNRRAEILVMEALIDDFAHPQVGPGG